MEERIGSWWFPDKSDIEFGGTLKISEDEIRLVVPVSIAAEHELITQQDHPPEIHGVAQGKYYILKSVIRVASNVNWPIDPPLHKSHPNEEFTVGGMFVLQNSRYIRDLSLAFHKVKVALTFGPHFIYQRKPIVTTSNLTADNQFSDISFEFSKTDWPTAELEDARLSIQEGFSTSGDNITSLTFQPKVWFVLESDTAKSHQEWIGSFVQPIANLLTFTFSKVSDSQEVHYFHQDNRKDEQEYPVELVTPAILRVRNSWKPDSSHRALLVDVPTTDAQFTTIFQQWIRIDRELGDVMKLLFSVERGTGQYVQNRFFSLATALEIYHRIRYSNEILPKEDFGALKSRIFESIQTEDDVRWLKDRLGFANTPSFRDRILELLREVPSVTKEFPDEDRFARLVVENRNYIAHFSRNPDSPWVFSGEALYRLSEVVKGLLKAHILRELELPPERILLDQNVQFNVKKLADFVPKNEGGAE